MQQVASRLSLAHRMFISNVWLLENRAGQRFVVDTGHVLERLTLRRALWNAGVRGRGDLAAVILTHRHSDHAGNAAWMRRTFDCPVVVHRLDAPFLDGTTKPPRMKSTGWVHDRLLCHIEDRFPARCVVDEVYDAGEFRWGFRVFHAPGHTEGSSMLHHEETATLFSGDVLLTGVPPLRRLEWLHLAVAAYSSDVERCHAAVRDALRELPRTETVAAGHGPAVLRHAHDKLMRLRGVG